MEGKQLLEDPELRFNFIQSLGGDAKSFNDAFTKEGMQLNLVELVLSMHKEIAELRGEQATESGTSDSAQQAKSNLEEANKKAEEEKQRLQEQQTKTSTSQQQQETRTPIKLSSANSKE